MVPAAGLLVISLVVAVLRFAPRATGSSNAATDVAGASETGSQAAALNDNFAGADGLSSSGGVSAAPTGLSKEVDTFNGQSLFKTFRETLPSAGVAWTCESGPQLEALAKRTLDEDVGSNVGEFWDSSDGSKRFLFYENATRTLVACDGKNVATTKFEAIQGLSPEEELVTVSDPAFADWDGDGAAEFKIFRGQCVEGPCLGGQIVIRQNGKTLTKLAELSGAQTKVSIQPGKPTTLLVQSPCYDYEFGSAFDSYYAVEFVGGRESVKMISFQTFRSRFPNVIEDLRKQSQTTYPDEAPIQKGFRTLQALVVKAYEGQPYEKLMSEYRETLKVFPPDVDQDGKPLSKIAERPPVHCDPPEILRMILQK